VTIGPFLFDEPARPGPFFDGPHTSRAKTGRTDPFATPNDRAPWVWMNPVFPKCPLCGREKSSRPIIAKNKNEIYWLFLLLRQMLGCCTLDN